MDVMALIKSKYKSVRQFAIEIDVYHNKKRLNAGIGGMAVDTVIKMARALDVMVDELIGAPPIKLQKAEVNQKRAELYAQAKASDDPVLKG